MCHGWIVKAFHPNKYLFIFIKVIELNLDNCQTDGEVVGLNDEFSSLKSLSIVNAGLTSVKGFPKLLKLQKVC